GEAEKGPALYRRAGDAANLFLRHARVVFQLERGERRAFVAAKAREGDDSADIGAAFGQAATFLVEVEGLALHPDVRVPGFHGWSCPSPSPSPQGGGNTHPPVIGGKKATSRAPKSAVSCSTCSWSSAARMTVGSAK